MPFKGFKCKQCGHCCYELGAQTYATREDYERWKKEGRDDILAWVDPGSVGDGTYMIDIWISPRTFDDVNRCPWLRKLPGKDKYICRIENTKPEVCRLYPQTKAHARQTKCPSVEKDKLMTRLKLISGGQTGADRAALDFAIKYEIPHGGWIPKGRRTEDGPLLNCYQMQETDSKDYRPRTENNILDSDGTLIVSHGSLTGGSALTKTLAKKHEKPWIHIDMETLPPEVAGRRIRDWIMKYNISVLNVAGSRGSKDSQIYRATTRLLHAALLLFDDEQQEMSQLNKKGLTPKELFDSIPVINDKEFLDYLKTLGRE